MTDVELKLARTSPEIRAAAEAIINIMYIDGETLEQKREKILQFFCQYNQFRSLQVERLKADLAVALRWSSRPTLLPKV